MVAPVSRWGKSMSVARKMRGRHRVELRNRPRRRRGAGAPRRRRGAELVHRSPGGPRAGRADRRRARRPRDLRPGRHGRGRRLPGAGRHAPPRRWAASTSWSTTPASSTSPRSPTSRSTMGPDHRDQPLLGLPHHRRRPAADARAGLGPHRQHRLRARPDRLAVQVRLRRRQARRRRLHQGGRARDRRGADHLQRHLPRLRADPARRGADPRHDEAVRHEPRAR